MKTKFNSWLSINHLEESTFIKIWTKLTMKVSLFLGMNLDILKMEGGIPQIIMSFGLKEHMTQNGNSFIKECLKAPSIQRNMK